MNIPIDTYMASFKLVFLFILVSFVHFATTKAQDVSDFLPYCSGNKTTPNSPFQSNLRTLLNYLSSNATAGNKEFYNTTVLGRNPSDTVYGLFMCRGDIPSLLCGQCVSKATQYNFSDQDYCSLSSEAVVYNEDDECMIRYSNRSFFTTVDSSFIFSKGNADFNVSASFMRLWLDTMNKTAEEAASSPILSKKYATNQVRISQFQCLYFLAQCTPDLSPQDCRTCLNVSMGQLQGGQSSSIQSPSCYSRYDFYPFYRLSKNPAPTGLIPAATSSSKTDSQDPDYLSHNCSSNEAFIANSAFLSNRRTLFSYLSSNATSITRFHNTSVGGGNPSDTVNGLFMCRGDTSPSLCQLCVQKATERISSECGSSKEGIIWYDHCLLRYSYRSFLPTGYDTSPTFHVLNMADTSNLNQQQSFFTQTLVETLSNVETATGESITTKNYGTATAKLNDSQTLYALGQCMPDLDNDDCKACLQHIFRHEIPWCCLASPEGKVLSPSCYMMFGLSKFYRDDDEAEASSHSSPPQRTTGEVPIQVIFAEIIRLSE